MTILALTIRQLMSGRRWLVLSVLIAIPILLSAVDRSMAAESTYMSDTFPAIVIAVVVPIIALILSGSVFASDIEEGTAIYVLAKPISRTRVLLERYAGTAIVALVLSLLTTVVSILIQTGRVENIPGVLLANGAAVALGAAVYTALFLALSLMTRRGIFFGLLYILLWESMLASQFAGTRTLSVKEYMLTVAGTLDRTGVAPETTSVAISTALTFASVIVGLSVLLALRKLRNFEVSEQG
jgi:ABC-2 type transport system permease protein